MRMFLQQLLETGRVTVPYGPAVPPLWTEVEGVIGDFDRAARMNLPSTLPELDGPAAFWAAGILMEGCRFLIAREADPSTILAVLSAPCPVARRAGTEYSVDLFFRFLPDLHRMARRLAQDDPLVKELERLGQDWPLSSVGMEGVRPVLAGDFLDHPALRQVYVDRIFFYRSTEQLQEPRVRNLVKASCGAYGNLCPEISRYLELSEVKPGAAMESN